MAKAGMSPAASVAAIAALASEPSFPTAEFAYGAGGGSKGVLSRGMVGDAKATAGVAGISTTVFTGGEAWRTEVGICRCSAGDTGGDRSACYGEGETVDTRGRQRKTRHSNGLKQAFMGLW